MIREGKGGFLNLMSPIKNRLGLFLIIILSALPGVVVLFFADKTFIERFADMPAILLTLGKISGLVGMTMFAITLILAGRFKFLEDYFGGLNKIYIVHHILGALSFVLLLTHPLFLAIRIAEKSTRAAAAFLTPGNSATIDFGLLALAGMILILFFMFFVKLPYQWFKNIQKVFGVAFIFAAHHMFLVTSDVSQNNFLRVYMLALSTLGIIVWIYKSLFGNIFPRRFKYSVNAIRQINDKVIEIEMSPITENKKMIFIAGQFVFVKFKNGGISHEEHPFSITSTPKEANFKLAIKALGDYTAELKNLVVGSTAEIDGPFGRFSYLNTTSSNFASQKQDAHAGMRSSATNNQIWIAGGIGITPFLSMAKSLPNNSEYKIDLYYCAKNKDEAVFIEELKKIAEQNKSFRVILRCEIEEGFLNIAAIKARSNELTDKSFFICGPPIMMKNLRQQLLLAGVSKKDIHSEEFSMS